MAHEHTTTDWHRADILAALKKNGWSLASLSRHCGYATRTALYQALLRKWPKGEAIIAEAIGVAPEVIWPTRYLNKFKREVEPRNVKKRKAA
ncbi:helix-turn-helix domain-containing protein [Thiofaba sp. EF100]|uniref:helix-turn-helix domain-containing protein n=1 Tax=Thiofaba sp. EF100 TaxID=3121274 RepID=UPI003221B93A